jgi:hypothetical protein
MPFTDTETAAVTFTRTAAADKGSHRDANAYTQARSYAGIGSSDAAADKGSNRDANADGSKQLWRLYGPQPFSFWNTA